VMLMSPEAKLDTDRFLADVFLGTIPMIGR
jgi:hypothetical protein